MNMFCHDRAVKHHYRLILELTDLGYCFPKQNIILYCIPSEVVIGIKIITYFSSQIEATKLMIETTENCLRIFSRQN